MPMPDAEPIPVLARRVVELFTARGFTLATCESLTGGLIGATITSVPGASAIYRGGFITYASDLKVRWAGVDADLVASRGVINEPTALQMARGVRDASGADVAVACTGVAGPQGQDGAEPGTVVITCVTAGHTTVSTYTFAGDREQVRRQTVEQALHLLRDYLD